MTRFYKRLDAKRGRMDCFPYKEANGLVVQMVRTLACHARGREFESLPGRHRILLGLSGPEGRISGSGSVVERRLAKANVASSNLVFRSMT